MEVGGDMGSVQENLVARGEGKITPAKVCIVLLGILSTVDQVFGKGKIGMEAFERGEGSRVLGRLAMVCW